MKVMLVLAVLLVLALTPVAANGGLLSARMFAATEHTIQTPEPAVLLVSGAVLLIIASFVRRYVR